MNSNTECRGDEAKRHQLNNLCNICLSNFPPDRPWPWVLQHVTPGSSGKWDFLGQDIALKQPSSNIQLLESSKAGCHLCTMFLEAIFPEKACIGVQQATGIERWVNPGTFRIHMLYSGDNWVLQMRHITDCFGKELKGVIDLCLDLVYRLADIEAPHPVWKFFPQHYDHSISIAATQPLSDTNISPPAIHQVKEWLRACTEKHDACRASKFRNPIALDSNFRLVDIGMNEDDPIHLVDARGSSEPETMQYCTLSYRWTAETTATNLKTENKTQFYQSIPTENWPKIYLDAVSITRQLGVRYLWIDSLCIIQNQADDWARQAALMGKIYSGGLLNLAAVEADRGTGLEVPRNPLRVAPCLLTLSLPDSCQQSFLVHRPDDIRKAVDRAPLYKRGWCFQERVLSRRTVHFADQLFWECVTLRASETLPLISDFLDRVEYLDNWIQSARAALWAEATPPREPLHRLWRSLVRFYTQTHLTKPQDRLIAIRGVADTLARQYGLSPTNDYLAGLWKPNMANQLLWARESETYSEEDGKLANKLATHFPSWSWASCPSEARFLDISGGSLIRVDSGHASNNNERAAESSHLLLMGWRVRSLSLTRLLAGNESCLEFPWLLPGEVAIHVELDRPVKNRKRYMDVCYLPVMDHFGNISGLVLSDIKQVRCGMRVFRRLGIFRGGSGHDDYAVMRALVPGWSRNIVGEDCNGWSRFMLV